MAQYSAPTRAGSGLQAVRLVTTLSASAMSCWVQEAMVGAMLACMTLGMEPKSSVSLRETSTDTWPHSHSSIT